MQINNQKTQTWFYAIRQYLETGQIIEILCRYKLINYQQAKELKKQSELILNNQIIVNKLLKIYNDFESNKLQSFNR